MSLQLPYLSGYERENVDFSVADAVVHNPFADVGTVMRSLSLSHALALQPAARPSLHPMSYCALSRLACLPGANPQSPFWPATPVYSRECDAAACGRAGLLG